MTDWVDDRCVERGAWWLLGDRTYAEFASHSDAVRNDARARSRAFFTAALGEPVVDEEALVTEFTEAISARLHITTDTIPGAVLTSGLSADTSAAREAADAVASLVLTRWPHIIDKETPA